MQKFILATSILGIIISSCGQNKVETMVARAYYDSINYQITSNKQLQQSLIDKATEVILAIKNDNSAKIDTKALRALLDSAKASNILRQRNIKNITEVDVNLNLKGKALDYVRLFTSFYDNEFKDLINLLDQEQEDKFTKASSLILPKLNLIKEKEIALKTAQEAFNAKYPLDADGNLRTKPDYEYQKLSDLKFRQADIKEGEEIKLLSFSGGKDCDDETIYFKQFIGIVKSTGDTIRILAACQLYDMDKPKRTCYFQNEISGISQNISDKKKLVAFNKHQAILEKKDFKTVIGFLRFKED